MAGYTLDIVLYSGSSLLFWLNFYRFALWEETRISETTLGIFDSVFHQFSSLYLTSVLIKSIPHIWNSQKNPHSSIPWHYVRRCPFQLRQSPGRMPVIFLSTEMLKNKFILYISNVERWNHARAPVVTEIYAFRIKCEIQTKIQFFIPFASTFFSRCPQYLSHRIFSGTVPQRQKHSDISSTTTNEYQRRGALAMKLNSNWFACV